MLRYNGFAFSCALAAALLAATMASAQETAPYPNGTSGLKCGTTPPPGRYWLMYNRIYDSHDSIGPDRSPAVDGNGDPLNFDLLAWANVHRFLWSTDYEILGAKYAWNFVIPAVVIDVDIGNYGIRETGFHIITFGWRG